jgi:CheY-like chemotaxis protein
MRLASFYGMHGQMQAREISIAPLGGRLAAANRGLAFTHGKPAQTALTGFRVVKRTSAPKRVLIIEDNLDSVHALTFLLADMGHDVEYAINGYAGIEMARRFRPDFVLLDIGLPGLDGFEVCSRIKKDADLQRTRVIAITAFAQEEYMFRSRAVGCELHLVKPVPVWLLEELLG